ncbi:DUF2207 domain-containing protein [Dethiobacter alkaliphilus]|uniref:DUF2207 domain-containing protein n=1 Tax=Dethiobacter alkaliphilus TaxID=427926 RepID=UPI002225CE62|nr:DUF2207 domain-containing protein [Dethiobacter alkaliphilus]MCW3490165.1 DUF2207 domain-containing protein [Dethiobacter alkaliphilus]
MMYYQCKPNTKLIISLLLLFVVVLSPAQGLAVSFHFPSVEIDARVQEDGSMLITEQRTVDFADPSRGMYMWIETPAQITISEMTVEENGEPYTYNPGDTEGPPGTFFTIEEDNRFFVDWSYERRDGIRSFTLRYRVEDVVLVHDDVAELYFQFIGDEWSGRADNVLVRMQLPSNADTEDIRAWGHGPLHGEVTIVDGQTVTWEVSPLPANTFLEGRVTFPTALVPAATQRTGQTALPDILAEEGALAEEANLERQRQQYIWIVAALLVVGSIILAFLIWKRYGKEYKPDFDGDYYRELPADYTPAELGVLWRFGTTQPEDLTATLVDLARKGHLSLEEYDPQKRGLFGIGGKKQDYRVTLLKKEGKLAAHEQKLLDFLFHKVAANQNELTFIELEEYAKKKRTSFAKFWQDWKYTLSARGVELDFFDSDVSTGKGIAIGLGVIMLPLGFLFGNALTPALLIGGFILIVTGALLRRRSRRGVEDFTRWRAFQRFLQHFSEMERHEIPSLVIWEHYLVYAITLGVAKEVIKQLQIVYPNMESGGHRFGGTWFYMYGARGPASFSSMTNSFDNLTSQISQSLQTATSSSSSGSGRGGGFTGGGGGGFGGGGGGAR